jgi:hypothetical protein
MSGALARATAAGTPAAVADRVQSPEFLMDCLRRAQLDNDLLQDVADACDMNDLNALLLASGELAPDVAADKLYLMQDEAKAVLVVCKRMCLKAGVSFGDGSVYVAEPGDDAEPGGRRARSPQPASATRTGAPKPGGGGTGAD